MNNPNLERLLQIISSGTKPSHGYTIAENGSEVVTAPGVYFPAEKGQVIPMQSRESGGEVSPSRESDTEKEKLGILKDILSQVRTNPNHAIESRQSGGPVSPDGEVSPLDQIEKTKYDIFKSAVSILKPPKSPSATGTPSLPGIPSLPGLPKPITSDSYGIQPDATKKLTDLIPRQAGGVVTPPKEEDELERLRRLMALESKTASRIPETAELESRRRWETPGYAEARPMTTPGYQTSYYDAHPEERLMDYVAEQNRPTEQLIRKSIEDERTRAQGYGRGPWDMMSYQQKRFGKLDEPNWGAGIPALTEALRRTTTGEIPGGMGRARTGTLPAGVTPLSTEGKLAADLRGGLITPTELAGQQKSPSPATTPIGLIRERLQERLGRPATAEEVKIEQDKEESRKVPEALKTFEAITGSKEADRGSKEYEDRYRKFIQNQREDRALIPADTMDRLSSMRTIHGTMLDVLNKVTTDENIRKQFGPVSGRWAALKVKFLKDPESTEVQRELNSLITIAYGLSGKQVSFREMEILKEALIPSLYQPLENFERSLGMTIDWITRSFNDTLKTYSEGGYPIKSLQPISGTTKQKTWKRNKEGNWTQE